MHADISLAERASLSDAVRLLAAQLAEHAITLDDDAITRGVAGLLEDPRRGCILLARAAGQPVGLACLSFIWTLEHGGFSVWLDELYVVPHLRSQGLGQKLVHAVIAHARSLGAAAIDLEVDEDHARAAHLYAREGFTPHRRARWVRPL
ncbi:MAG: GNAT family N-acetyltransferase [Polyangiaceae bacterium]